MAHLESSPLAGQMVLIGKGELEKSFFRVEDWWDRVADQEWTIAAYHGNLACRNYGERMIRQGIPDPSTINEVLYGKIGGLGYLVHVTEVLHCDFCKGVGRHFGSCAGEEASND